MNTVCQQHSICQLCKKDKANYIIKNIHNGSRLGVCKSCKERLHII